MPCGYTSVQFEIVATIQAIIL